MIILKSIVNLCYWHVLAVNEWSTPKIEFESLKRKLSSFRKGGS